MYNGVAVENGVSGLGHEIRFLLPRTLAIVVAVLAFAYADVLAAQRITPPQRLPETTGPLIVGQIIVRVQQDTGAPFLNPATIMLRSPDMSVDLRSRTDGTGQTEFTNVPSGQYLLEASSPGYGTVREQVAINTSGQVQDIVVAMIPDSGLGLSGASRAGIVPPKAIKETEKGLRALQVGKLNDTQSHLTRALTIAPNFADGNYLMGVLFLRRNDSGKALVYLQKAVDVAPTHTPALLALGEAAYLQRDFARATTSLEQCLREQPRGPQAATAQELIARMGESGLTPPERVGGGDQSSSAQLVGHKVSVNTLKVLTAITPITETSWLPPDIDEQKIALAPGAPCHLNEVLQASGERVKELVENVERFTATEEVEHFRLSPLGLQVSKETRKFDYMVEIRQLGAHDLDVEEYRNGSVSGQQFPGHISTNGLPTLALVFHPYQQDNHQFACEGRGMWRGTPAWIVHFQQRADRTSTMLVYHVGTKFFAVGLKGRAWIDAQSSQILAIETDTMRPVPEIRLMRDHQLIEYGPVGFKNDTMHLWLPKSADWYSSLAGQRYHRRHTFSQFLLFSVNDSQKISRPKDGVDPVPNL